MVAPLELNLRHLRALGEIAIHGSMTAAAGVVSLSQPALTQGIARLEAQLGCALFVRRPDGMAPTERGARVIARSRLAFARLETTMRGVARGSRRPEMLLTATQLRGLLGLADAGSYAGAAQALGVSQPALHRAVRELQAVCGVVLVERHGRGVRLTPAARALVRGFRLAVADLAAAIEESRPDPALEGRVVVGAMPLSRAYLLPQAMVRLLRLSPGVRFDVVEGSFADLAAPLREGAVDLLVGALRDPCPADLAQQPLLSDRLSVVARAGHPLAGTQASLADLARYPWITGRPGSPLRARWEAMFAPVAPVRPVAPVACGSVMAIRGLLTGTDCLTLLSFDQVAMEIGAGVLADLGPAPVAAGRVIGTIVRRDWRPTRLQARFLDLLAAVASGDGNPENE